MSDLIVAALKIAFLALLWLFIAFVADVVRRDMFGRTVAVGNVGRTAEGLSTNVRNAPAPTRFVVTQGNQQGLSLPAAATINLGRAPDSTFILDDDYASARHAQLLQADANTWVLTDLDSTNGTFVNGQRVTGSVSVTAADVIRIGKTQMRLEP